MAEPYRSQIQSNPAPLSGGSAESFGASAGRGMEEAGAQIDQTIHRFKERDRDMQAAAAGVDLAQLSTQMDKDAIDARSNAAPGGAGHTDTIEKTFDEQSAAALGKIKDPHIRAAFTARYAELKDHIVGREYGWEAGARVDKLTNDVDETGSTLAAGQASNPDPAGLQVSLDTIHSSIDAMALPADLKTKLIKEQQRKVAVAWGNAMQNVNPHLLIGALDKGLLSPYLEGNDVNVLRDGGLVEVRRQEALARAEQARAEAAARESISTLLNKVGDGYVPTDDEWKQASSLATTYKLEGPEWNLGVAKDKADVNRETRDWTPTQWHSAINTLEAKGDKRTAADNVRLTHLKEAGAGAISRFNSDPFAAAAAAGTPAPDVDWANPKPADVEKRVAWARSYARSAGLQNVPYLSVDETKALRDRTAQGPAGQLEVATQVRNTFGIATASEIIKQIDPDNKDLQIMVGLHPRMAELYKRGIEAQKAGTVKLGADGQDSSADTEAMRATFAEFMPAIPTDLQPAVLNAARAMTAGRAAETGHTQLTGDELTGALRAYIHRAGGMLGSTNEGSATGGFARWNGRYAWLPPTMSREDFQRRMSRADGGAWLRAGGGAPYYQGPDGKLAKMSDTQIAHFSEYRLDTVNPGLYQLLGPDGGHVVDKDGRPWQFDVRKLGSSFDAQLAEHGYSRH